MLLPQGCYCGACGQNEVGTDLLPSLQVAGSHFLTGEAAACTCS